MRKSVVKASEFLDSLNDLVQSVAPDGSFIYVNRVWRETLGYDERDVALLNLFDIIHPDSKAHCRDAFERLLRGEKSNHLEVEFLTHDGNTIAVEGNSSCRIENGK